MNLAEAKRRRGGMPPKQKTQVMPTLSAQATSRDGERIEHMMAWGFGRGVGRADTGRGRDGWVAGKDYCTKVNEQPSTTRVRVPPPRP